MLTAIALPMMTKPSIPSDCKRERSVSTGYLLITVSQKGKTSPSQAQPHPHICGMWWRDSALTCRNSIQTLTSTCHCIIYFCMCDIGVHVISCLDNYIMTMTNASLVVCTCRRSLSIDCLPTAMINLLILFLAQDILKLCITWRPLPAQFLSADE